MLSHHEQPTAATLRELGLDKLCGKSADEMDRVLKCTSECVAWCEQRADVTNPEFSLRSQVLKTELILGTDIESYDWNYSAQDAAGLVRELCEKRSNLLEHRPSSDWSSLVDSGRYLVFWPDETLRDGAACQATRGYFDVSNIPPWDTWVYYGPVSISKFPALIAWVPSAFVDSVSEGLWTNPEECIQWLRADLQGTNYNRRSTTSTQHYN